MKKLLVVTALASAMFITGCAQKNFNVVGSEKVKELNYSQFENEFVIGKTTLDEAKAKLGKPETQREVKGENVYIWTYTEAKGEANAASMIPIVGIFAGKVDINTKSKFVSLTFNKDGVLSNKDWRDTTEKGAGFKGLFSN